MVAPKFDPARRCRPVEEWPEVDQGAWQAALIDEDPLEVGGIASGWAQLTRKGAVKAYGRWLTWLVGVGRLTPTPVPAGQITPELVREFLIALGAVNAPMTVVHRVESLARVAHALAPDREWNWLWHISGQLKRRAFSVRDKHSRLVEPRDLFALGEQLMTEAEAGVLSGKAISPWRCAVRYRDGLMVAFLALRPLRLQNLVGIEIGRQLIAQGEGYSLRFEAAETKTRRRLEQPFPQALHHALERYLSHYRPILCARRRLQTGVTPEASCRSLWVGNTGVGLSPVNVHARIVELTRQAFGRSVSPHLFRDCAATSIATEAPSQVRIVMSVLGHTGLATSERHYNHANSVQAARLHQAHIQALRRKAHNECRAPALSRD